jgi:hypothetical protein
MFRDHAIASSNDLIVAAVQDRQCLRGRVAAYALPAAGRGRVPRLLCDGGGSAAALVKSIGRAGRL